MALHPEKINWGASSPPALPETGTVFDAKKAFAKMSMAATGLLAALCVLAFPLWILGAPGVENEYARGWLMGLQVLIAYPLCWIATLTVWFIRSRKAVEKSNPAIDPMILLMLVLCAAASARIWFALQVMP